MADNKHFGLNWTELKLHEKGCVTKHQRTATKRCNYVDQGYDYIKANKQSVYNQDLTSPDSAKRTKSIGRQWGYKFGMSKVAENILTPSDPTKKRNKRAWWIPNGRNFKTANLPYLHQYHHLLPGNVLHSSFGYRELGVLMYSRYNLNDGWNLIILPMQYKIGKILSLPYHFGSHPQYDEGIISFLQEIKSDIEEARKDEKHPIDIDNVPAVKEELDDYEKTLFDEVRSWGESEPGIAINDISVSI